MSKSTTTAHYKPYNPPSKRTSQLASHRPSPSHPSPEPNPNSPIHHQHYLRYNSASPSASLHPSPIIRSSSSETPPNSNQPHQPTNHHHRQNLNQPVPFRPGFQPKGVYRDRTDELINLRNSKQESKRLEESRLQKRLEKLIELHLSIQPSSSSLDQFHHQQTTSSSASSSSSSSSNPTNVSSKLIGIVLNGATNHNQIITNNNNSLGGRDEPGFLSHLTRATAGMNGSSSSSSSIIRSKEQAIVRWQDDREVKRCKDCQTQFGLRVRKHHCRLCGSIVCFSPTRTSNLAGQQHRERCSSMIRFELESYNPPPGERERLGVGSEGSIIVKIVPLTDQEMGILDDPRSVLDLISPSNSTTTNSRSSTIPTSTTTTIKSGIRVCRVCLTIILRRQAMTFPPKIPDYILIYNLLNHLQLEIGRSIPELQELLANSHSSSNLNPTDSRSTTTTSTLKLLTIRKKLLKNLSLFDTNSKELSKLLKLSHQNQYTGNGQQGINKQARYPKNHSEIRLLNAIITRAGLFLRDHMSLIRSIGILEPSTTTTNNKNSNPLNSKLTPSSSSSSTTTRSRLIRLPKESTSKSDENIRNKEEDLKFRNLQRTEGQDQEERTDLNYQLFQSEVNDSNGELLTTKNQNDKNELLIHLNVLLEQEIQLESFILKANLNRQFDDVKSLKSSLDDLRFEISNLKKKILI